MEEDIALLRPDQDYPLWTPYDAFDAAEALLNALEGEQSKGQQTMPSRPAGDLLRYTAPAPPTHHEIAPRRLR